MRASLIIFLLLVLIPYFTTSLEILPLNQQDRDLRETVSALLERLRQQQQIQSQTLAAGHQLQNIYRLALKTASDVDSDDPSHQEALQKLKLATLENAQALGRITESITNTQEELHSVMRRQ